MRRPRYAVFAISAFCLSACGGSSGGYANKPKPAVPVNLTVYINDARVSVSPASVGAGPVAFIITNAARSTESLTIKSPDGSSTLASTGPINPETTAQVTVDFNRPGDYTVATGGAGGTAAQQATTTPARAATIHVGKARPSGSDALLLP
jgi:hypothetical protein